MALRDLIGLGEAFTTNAFIFASLWYKPEELAVRVGKLFWSVHTPPFLTEDTGAIYGMTPIAGAISGIMAYGVGRNLEVKSGLKSWEWLFVIGGVATCGFAFIVLIFLPGLPEETAAKGSYLFRSHEDLQTLLRRFEKCK